MDRTNPMDLHLNAMIEERGMTESPITAQMFGNAGREHMEKYGMPFCSSEIWLYMYFKTCSV